MDHLKNFPDKIIPTISMSGARTKVPVPEPQTAIPVAIALFFFKRNELKEYHLLQ